MNVLQRYKPESGANWNRLRQGGVWMFDGETAIIRCPKCGTAQNLSGQMITGAGIVEFECRNGADFVDTIILASWVEGFQRKGNAQVDQSVKEEIRQAFQKTFAILPEEDKPKGPGGGKLIDLLPI
jgi:hypothetical protein